MSNSRGRRQVHAYNPAEIERLRSIVLPPKIKCGRHGRHLPLAKFSEKQLTDARYQISKSGRISKPVLCQDCAGGKQIVEIECTFCNHTKGLEEFAKSQRSNPDTAKCFRCTEEQVTREPVTDEKYEDPDKAFVTPDTSGGHMPDYWTSASSMAGFSGYCDHDWSTVNGETNDARDNGGVALSSQFQRAMSINGSVPETLIDSEYSYPATHINNNGHVDGWSESRTMSWHTGSIGTVSISAGSSFDPNRYGRPSTTSRAGTVRTYASSVAERSEASDARPHGWSKIKAYKPTSPTQVTVSPIAVGACIPGDPVRSPFVRPDGDAQSEVKEDTNPWGSDEEDEEEDDGDDSDDSDGENTVI